MPTTVQLAGPEAFALGVVVFTCGFVIVALMVLIARGRD